MHLKPTAATKTLKRFRVLGVGGLLGLGQRCVGYDTYRLAGCLYLMPTFSEFENFVAVLAGAA